MAIGEAIGGIVGGILGGNAAKMDRRKQKEMMKKMVAEYDLDIKVAVMGCVVNGPGEAREADIGIAGGMGEGLLIRKGEVLRKVPESDLLTVLREELENWGG